MTNKHTVTIGMMDDEFRVPGPDGREETAYYTDDIDDALATAWAMYGKTAICRFKFEDWSE